MKIDKKTRQAAESIDVNATRQDGQDGQSVPVAPHESRHREILLTRGRVALVDAEDYAELSRFRWSFQPNGQTGYAVRGAKQPDGGYSSELMHRRILGAGRGQLVDHINGDGLDNRRANLRLASPAQNAANRKAKGASFHSRRNKWVARITADGRCHWLGYFDTQDAAAAAYASARARLCGPFAGKVFQ